MWHWFSYICTECFTFFCHQQCVWLQRLSCLHWVWAQSVDIDSFSLVISSFYIQVTYFCLFCLTFSRSPGLLNINFLSLQSAPASLKLLLSDSLALSSLFKWNAELARFFFFFFQCPITWERRDFQKWTFPSFFFLHRILTRLLEVSDDPQVIAVAAHDIGEYVRHYPRGKR